MINATCMHLKCISLSERTQIQKATYNRIPFIINSGKCKTTETENKSTTKKYRGIWEIGMQEMFPYPYSGDMYKTLCLS